MFGKSGQSIDQFTLLLLIRQNVLSELWLAREGFPGGHEVLIKLFPTDYPGSSYFKREITALSRLDPEYVVLFRTSGYAGGCDYLVIELVAWRTLREVIWDSKDGLSLNAGSM